MASYISFQLIFIKGIGRGTMVIIPISQTGKPRLREVVKHAQGHTTRKWQGWGLHPGLRDPQEPMTQIFLDSACAKRTSHPPLLSPPRGRTSHTFPLPPLVPTPFSLSLSLHKRLSLHMLFHTAQTGWHF